MAIESFKHKGLEKLFVEGDGSKIQAQLIRKIILILIALDTVKTVPDDLKGLRQYEPHKLKGKLSEYWALSVSGNYRITFKFDSVSNTITHVDLLDYH